MFCDNDQFLMGSSNLLKYRKFIRGLGIHTLCLCSLMAPVVLSAEGVGEPLLPIPTPKFVPEQMGQIRLGRSLFNDPRLSHDNSTSCASCHSLKLAGTDRRRVSIGINGAMGVVNAPTVINSTFNLAQFWDGRATSLEEQAAGPIHNPVEMGSDWAEVLEKLNRDEIYSARFAALYEDGMTVANIQHAIAQFEHSLVTVDAPFDRYLRGEQEAISDEAKRGYSLFKSYGCVACHQGRNVGGNMYARMGAVDNYFISKEKLETSDLGRYNVTGDEYDQHVFKVPSLRLVSYTAPYFHDGSAETLEEAVSTMAKYQPGRNVNSDDRALIIAFLETLAGTLYEIER